MTTARTRQILTSLPTQRLIWRRRRDVDDSGRMLPPWQRDASWRAGSPDEHRGRGRQSTVGSPICRRLMYVCIVSGCVLGQPWSAIMKL